MKLHRSGLSDFFDDTKACRRARRGTGLAARPAESAFDATVGFLLPGASDTGEFAEESDTPGIARYAAMPAHDALNVKGPAGHLVDDRHPKLP
jgi:hypothetical protein